MPIDLKQTVDLYEAMVLGLDRPVSTPEYGLIREVLRLARLLLRICQIMGMDAGAVDEEALVDHIICLQQFQSPCEHELARIECRDDEPAESELGAARKRIAELEALHQ